MYIYIYKYVYVYVYICICIYINVCIYIYIFTYRFMNMLEHTARRASDGNMEHSKYRSMICTGSQNDSGMGMSFTWHGSGMERVWNGYGTAYGTK